MNVVIAIDSFKGSMTSPASREVMLPSKPGKVPLPESGAYIRMQISPSVHLQTVAKAQWTL